ncbi:hypothetical protein H7100_00740 [Candidatus Saccharibacteria bacterium]|nr:hypothetical protein [Candidatus Saccharibacteria bacterium]
MNPTIKALLAIGSAFAWRIYLPILVITSISAIIVVGLSIWLVTMSAWWWILLILILIAVFISAAILFIIGILIQTVRPHQGTIQKHEVERFVDKIQAIADVAGTPKIVILFRITRDLVSKKEDSYTRRISSETLSMQHDLRDIVDGFK